MTLSNRFLSCCLKGAQLLYKAQVANRVMDDAEGFEGHGSRSALLAAVLTTNLGLMLLPPLISLLFLAGVLR